MHYLIQLHKKNQWMYNIVLFTARNNKNNMKQTAVEWLQKQLECFGNKHELQMSWATVDELLEQAKEMEKEQIENAYEIGFADAWDDARYDDEPKYATAEQYYKETFK